MSVKMWMDEDEYRKSVVGGVVQEVQDTNIIVSFITREMIGHFLCLH